MRILGDIGNTFDFRAKIRIFIENWHWKSPKQKFQILYNIPKIMFEWIGVRVLSDSHINYYSHFGNLLVFYYVSMTIHTLYYWNQKDQLLFGTRCLCGMGIMMAVIYLYFLLSNVIQKIKILKSIQTIPLYWESIGANRFKFNSLLNVAGNYMYEDFKGKSKFSAVCEEGAHKMLKSYAILMCIICTSMSLVALGPIIVFFRTGIWMTPLGVQFPLADQSDLAFYLDLVIQMFIAVTGIFSTVSIEFSQVIVNNVIEMSADVIKLNINQLMDQIAPLGQMNLRSRAQFYNIVVQIQDFDR